MNGESFRRMPRCEHCGTLRHVFTASELLSTNPPPGLVETVLELRDLVGHDGLLTVCPGCLCITTLEPIAGRQH